MDITCFSGGTLPLALIIEAINSKADKTYFKLGMMPYGPTIVYTIGDIAYVPGVGPVEYVGSIDTAGNDPATDDGTYWVNWEPIVMVDNATSAFGIPLKPGTLVIDKDTFKIYGVTATATAAESLSDITTYDISKNAEWLLSSTNTWRKPQITTTTILTFGPTVNINMSLSQDYMLVTEPGEFLIDNPTGATTGQHGDIIIDLAGTAPSWGDWYNFGEYTFPKHTTGKLCLHYHVLSLSADGIIMSYAGGY